jgi:outer membrane receptor protein involved in Fe transport
VRYQSDRFTSFENSLKMDSYWLVDLRIGARNERYSITGYVNNLFNDDTLKASAVYLQNWTISFLPPRPTTTYSGGSAILPDKRQFGVRANVNF